MSGWNVQPSCYKGSDQCPLENLPAEHDSISAWLFAGCHCPCHSVAGGNVSVHQLIMLIVQHISMTWLSLVKCITIPGCELGQPESRHTFPSANRVIRSCNFSERREIKSWNNDVLNCFIRLRENLLVRTIRAMFIFREGWDGVLFVPLTFYFCFLNLFESTRDRAERGGEKLLGPSLCLMESPTSKLFLSGLVFCLIVIAFF